MTSRCASAKFESCFCSCMGGLVPSFHTRTPHQVLEISLPWPLLFHEAPALPNTLKCRAIFQSVLTTSEQRTLRVLDVVSVVLADGGGKDRESFDVPAETSARWALHGIFEQSLVS